VETDSALKIRPSRHVWNLIGHPSRQLVVNSTEFYCSVLSLISTFMLINYRKFKIFSKYSCPCFCVGVKLGISF